MTMGAVLEPIASLGSRSGIPAPTCGVGRGGAVAGAAFPAGSGVAGGCGAAEADEFDAEFVDVAALDAGELTGFAGVASPAAETLRSAEMECVPRVRK